MRNGLLNTAIGFTLLATSACSPAQDILGTEASPISTLPPFPTSESPQTGEENPVMCIENQWWNRHDIPYGGEATVVVDGVTFTLYYPNTNDHEYVAQLVYSYVNAAGQPVSGVEPYRAPDVYMQSRFMIGSNGATVYVLIFESHPMQDGGGVPVDPNYYLPPSSEISAQTAQRPEVPKYDIILADRTDSQYICGLWGPRAELPSTDN